MYHRSTGHIAIRVVVAFAAFLAAFGIAVVTTPAKPAMASCPSIVDAQWMGDWSNTMRQDGITCTERWARLTIDYPSWGGISVRIEREAWSPYGWYLTHKYRRTVGSMAPAGIYSTSRTPNTGSDDRHRICWSSAFWDGDSWQPTGENHCNDWVY